MKNRVQLIALTSTVLLVLGVIQFGVNDALAQGPSRNPRAPRVLAGTAFTYQGQLKNGSALVNATCDFQFGLWDDSSVGAQVGATQTITSVVTNGLFTVQLNASGQITTGTAFNGEARWLASTVRCPSGSGSYTALNPRQPLNPAPMAFALPGLYTQQNSTSPNVIGGYSGNFITPTLVGATIGGGGLNSFINRVTGNYGTVGGGFNNTASGTATIGGGASNTAGNLATVGGGVNNHAEGTYSTIGGGQQNNAIGLYATVGGGQNNNALANYATVAGGLSNNASGIGSTVGGGGFDGTLIAANIATGNASTIGGGLGNLASGSYATVPGGIQNYAIMSYTLAAGRRANANHDGTFVWGDSTNSDFASTGNNQFLIRAGGGIGVNTNAPIANTLTVNGTVIAGGTNTPAGVEPFVSEGGFSGISMDDRSGGGYPRWVVFPQSGSLNFWNATNGSVVSVNGSGKLTAAGGFNGQCLSSTTFDATPSSSCNMDVAEAFASIELTAPGDLVTLVPQNNTTPTVRKSNRAYNDLLIGVVSQNPGLVFDNGATHLAGDNSQLITKDKTIVALVGRVQVNASIENGAIEVGNALTSSSKPGFAMKATRAGRIIGYAMENANQDGKALALVQPGYYLPPDQVELAQKNAELEARIAALEKTSGMNARANTETIPMTWVLFGGLVILGFVVTWRKS